MAIKKLTPKQVRDLSYEEKLNRIDAISSALVANFSPSQIKNASIKKLYPNEYENSAVVRATDSPIKLVGASFGARELTKENLRKLDR